MAARAARAELFNKGVESSRGSILLFLHPDRIVGPDFLLRHLLPYLAQEPHPAIVLGRDENDILTHLFTQEESRGNSAPIQTMLSPAELHDDVRLSKLTIPRAGATTAVFSHFHARRRQPPHPWSHFCSANASIYRTAFDASGGFDERFGDWGVEDIDLGMRLHRAGYRFAFAPEAASIRQVQPASEGNVRLLDRDICLLLSMHPDMTSVEREIVRRTSFIPSAH
jgi:GT2 family glycosyltransferase